MKKTSKICPLCGHEFQGNGWDGIDAHWRAHHEHEMPYEQAWPLIQLGALSTDEAYNPEACYRRGYQQGAYATLNAIDSTPIAKVRAWVEEKLWRWRYEGRIYDRNVSPPAP
jgi:hypothetical protein